MRAAIQRISSARVCVDNEEISRIGPGLLIYLGVADGDDENDLCYVVDKVCGLRIFPDEDGKMNLDAKQANVEVLVVSAFTLLADARKGRRPSFSAAADPDVARQWYERFRHMIEARGLVVRQGKFRAMMEVHSVNDGPICILLDSKRVF